MSLTWAFSGGAAGNRTRYNSRAELRQRRQRMCAKARETTCGYAEGVDAVSTLRLASSVVAAEAAERC